MGVISNSTTIRDYTFLRAFQVIFADKGGA